MKKLQLFLLITLGAMVAATATAKKKKAAKKETEEKVITVTDMYAFGCCTSLNDSIVYLTDIQQLPTVRLAPKTKFLEHRAEFSRQLKQHFVANGQSHMTCAIIYDRDRKKLEKSFVKIYNRNQANGESLVKLIPLSAFSFEKIEE